MSLTIGSLFSGIGGLELGLEMCGLGLEMCGLGPEMCGLGPEKWQCDSDPCARAVLTEHWPSVKRYEDVREIDERAERVDVICGGFPCQPVSLAGKRLGAKDARWLWPAFAEVLGAVVPRFVFIENVPGLRRNGLHDVLYGLAALGYDATWGCFAAAEVGAPHRRSRIFVLAHAYGEQERLQQRRSSGADRLGQTESGHDGVVGDVANADGEGQLQPSGSVEGFGGRVSDAGGWATEPDVGRVAHGVPGRVDRLRLLGNACVPAQAALAWRTLIARVA